MANIVTLRYTAEVKVDLDVPENKAALEAAGWVFWMVPPPPPPPPPSPPVISLFAAGKPSYFADEPIILEWEVTGEATQVTLGNSGVSKKGAMTVPATGQSGARVFNLVASGPGGSVSEILTVEVKPVVVPPPPPPPPNPPVPADDHVHITEDVVTMHHHESESFPNWAGKAGPGVGIFHDGSLPSGEFTSVGIYGPVSAKVDENTLLQLSNLLVYPDGTAVPAHHQVLMDGVEIRPAFLPGGTWKDTPPTGHIPKIDDGYDYNAERMNEYSAVLKAKSNGILESQLNPETIQPDREQTEDERRVMERHLEEKVATKAARAEQEILFREMCKAQRAGTWREPVAAPIDPIPETPYLEPAATFDGRLQQLRDMGFTDEQLAIAGVTPEWIEATRGELEGD